MALPFAVVAGVLLVALVGELLLGFFVLERGDGRLPTLLLAAFMLVHATVFAVFMVWQIGRLLYGLDLTVSGKSVGLAVLPFAPALLLAFALSYPTPAGPVREHRALLWLPLVPAVVHAVWMPVDPGAALRGVGVGNAPISFLFFLIYLFAGAAAAAALLWIRSRRARTDLKRRRLAYMAKVIAGPTALVGLAFVPLLVLLEGTGVDATAVLFTMLAPIVLVPAFGLGYGVLKYQVLDIDVKVKTTLEKSTLVGAFGFAFLVVSEGVEILIGVDGALYGIVAAVVIGAFFRRIEDGAERFADRLMPGVEDSDEHRAKRKEELYRATLEEVLADGQMTTKDRRVLLSLQDNLDLAEGEASRLEREVLDDIEAETS